MQLGEPPLFPRIARQDGGGAVMQHSWIKSDYSIRVYILFAGLLFGYSMVPQFDTVLAWHWDAGALTEILGSLQQSVGLGSSGPPMLPRDAQMRACMSTT